MLQIRTLLAWLIVGTTTVVANPPQTATWLGGTGSWSNPAKWSTGVVPNNTPTDTYSVVIDRVGGADSLAYVGTLHQPVTYTIDSLAIQAGGELRWFDAISGTTVINCLSGVALDGRISFDPFSNSTLVLGTNGVIAGTGTIAGTVSGYQDGAIHTSLGTLTIGEGITVGGGIGLGTVANPLVNRGMIRTDGGQLAISASSLHNFGTLLCNGGRLTINSDFSFDSIGTLINSAGTVHIGGSFDNTNRTFRVDAANGNWELGGTLNGGTLETGDGRALVVNFPSNGTINNVAVNGQISIGTNRTLFVPAGQALQGSGTILLGGVGSPSAGKVSTDTIEPTMTVRGRGTVFSGLESALTPLVNRGHIIADSAGNVLDIRASTLLNTGSIEVMPGAILGLGSTFKIDELGTVINNGGILRITGTLDNADRTFQINGSSGTWELAGTIRGGTLDVASSQHFRIPEFANARLEDTYVHGLINVGDGGRPATLTISTGPAGSSGVFNLPHVRSGLLCDGDATMTIGSSMQVMGVGVIDAAGKPLVNNGFIYADSMNIRTSHFYNRGALGLSGNVHLFGDIVIADLGTFTNSGTVRINGTLQNSGRTFQPGVTVPGAWTLFDGTINGGTVVSPPGGTFLIFGQFGAPRLQDVSLVGSFTVARQVLIYDGIDGNAQIRVNGGMLDGQPTLDIGSGITVVGGVTKPSSSNEYGIGWRYTEKLTNAGTILATLVDNVPRTMRIKAGEIDHAGTIASINGGTFVISTDVFHHAGNVTLDSNARLRFKEDPALSWDTDVIVQDGGAFVIGVGSSTGTGNPFFDLAGMMYFDGLLNLGSLNDYLTLLPQGGFVAGQSYTIIDYTNGLLIGQFDHVSPDWTVDYSVAGKISVRFVPEPGAALLLAVALVLLAGRLTHSSRSPATGSTRSAAGTG